MGTAMLIWLPTCPKWSKLVQIIINCVWFKFVPISPTLYKLIQIKQDWSKRGLHRFKLVTFNDIWSIFFLNCPKVSLTVQIVPDPSWLAHIGETGSRLVQMGHSWFKFQCNTSEIPIVIHLHDEAKSGGKHLAPVSCKSPQDECWPAKLLSTVTHWPSGLHKEPNSNITAVTVIW